MVRCEVGGARSEIPWENDRCVLCWPLEGFGCGNLTQQEEA